ncbi:MAG: VCBS repeat-containing protein [Pedosphaera sp.]|nr:VCBS repeat-containing protein [Pedosphaera sp.]
MIHTPAWRLFSGARAIAWLLTAGLTGWIEVSLRSEDVLEGGRQLATQYCSACHLLPEPALLDRRTWREGTKPMMRKRLGLESLRLDDPAQRQIMAEWELIWNYYETNAPVQMPRQPVHPPIGSGLTRFEPVFLEYHPTNRLICMVQIDSTRHQIYAGNARAKTLDTLSADGHLLASLSLNSPPVEMVPTASGYLVPLIGNVLPHDGRLGKVVRLRANDRGVEAPVTLIPALPRPTSVATADLNGDGRLDIVVCGYGHTVGSFGWWESRGSEGYTEHVLLDRPGAIHAVIRDFDRDGRPDILVLMAQAQEELCWFRNLGGGLFEQRSLLRFQSVWGSTSFEVADFNGDGMDDILITNGDNGEYKSCLKPYHAIRIYLNDGQQNLSEGWSYPLNGAFKAIARDFDGDGDLDIAAISFFPDYENSPLESFVYFENNRSGNAPGALNFVPQSLDEAVAGRWLVMDAGDLDGDGDLDIVLGSANHVPFGVPKALYERWETEGPVVLLLRNTTKSPKQRPSPKAK